MISLRFLRIFASFLTIQSTGLTSSTPIKSISEHLLRSCQYILSSSANLAEREVLLQVQ